MKIENKETRRNKKKEMNKKIKKVTYIYDNKIWSGSKENRRLRETARENLRKIKRIRNRYVEGTIEHEKEKQQERRMKGGCRTSWKSIFHRIERFALPGIFLSSPKAFPLAQLSCRISLHSRYPGFEL